MAEKYNKWVACWGNATSVTDRKEAVYAKDITLRYPIFMPFSGSKLRLRFSNLTGTEPVTLSKIVLRKKPSSPLQLAGFARKEAQALRGTSFFASSGASRNIHHPSSITIAPGKEVETDEIELPVEAGTTLEVSIYLKDFTQMNAGTLITGPLSKGQYAYGDYAEADQLPPDLTRHTNWFYFLNTIDILTEEKNHALVCYGDSITAQSWPDYLALRAWREGYHDVAIIRRAVSGTRILRQYDCITYQAYGLKGATRWPIETNVSGMSSIIIQHGINDIIHPVGTDVNPFRPWSDLPTVQELEKGVEEIYLKKISPSGEFRGAYSGTLLPIYGWRTYNEMREEMRREFNEWLRTSPLFAGCVDFDKAVCDTEHPERFAPGFDSGDHLHPSETAYEAMANAVPAALLKA